MKKLGFLISCLVFQLTVHAQRHALSLDAGYLYVYSPAFDKVIQYYNFSRPWQNREQALLQNGVRGALTYSYKFNKRLAGATVFDFMYFPSVGRNEPQQIAIHPKAYTLGLQGYYSPFDSTSFFKRLRFSVGAFAGLLSTHLRENKAPLWLDAEEEEKYKSNTFLYGFQLQMDYTFWQTSKHVTDAFVKFGFWPQVEIDDFAETFIGTNMYSLENEGFMWMFSIGLKHSLRF